MLYAVWLNVLSLFCSGSCCLLKFQLFTIFMFSQLLFSIRKCLFFRCSICEETNFFNFFSKWILLLLLFVCFSIIICKYANFSDIFFHGFVFRLISFYLSFTFCCWLYDNFFHCCACRSTISSIYSVFFSFLILMLTLLSIWFYSFLFAAVVIIVRTLKCKHLSQITMRCMQFYDRLEKKNSKRKE